MTTTPIKVLIADDSSLVRRIIRTVLTSDPLIQVVGEARNGLEAVELVAKLRPDIVTMDVRMPVLDGLGATEEIMAYHPTPILVLTGSIDRHDSGFTFQMLSAGALEVIEKPRDFVGSQSEAVRRHLIERVKMLARVKVVTHLRGRRRSRLVPAAEDAAAPVQLPAPLLPGSQRVVLIGASTGGPKVLHTMLGMLPPTFAGSLVIVQHIAEGFVANMVEWRGGNSALPVVLAADGMIIRPRQVIVAPDTHHLRLDEQCRISLDLEPRALQYPSIDVTMHSAAEHCAKRTIGVILSGMGRDGAAGLLALRRAGAATLVQDEASSAIFGMPRAALENGAASETVSAAQLAARLVGLTALPQVP
ncbi:MAG TPA: chemotaxis-specific protein-glutamate methyltransferase CheB [Herpetosiphonaceae bacterium]